MSTTPPNISLVPILAGGGTRLSAHVGVLSALQKLDIGYDHLVGVSGGSIVAALFAAGKDLEEIKELSLGVDFRQFRGYSLYQLVTNGGLSTGHKFEQWLLQQIGNVTFADLELDLHIVATDVQTGRPVVFSRELTPSLSVVQAVRCSMGIPLLFTFQLFQQQILVDGSILAEEALRQDWSGKGLPACIFRIRSNIDPPQRSNKPPRLPRFIAMLIRTFMTTLSREYVHDIYWNSTIVINSEAISPLEFSLSRASKEKLFQAGMMTTLQYLPIKLKRSQ